MNQFFSAFMNFVQIASFFLFLILAIMMGYCFASVNRANRKINRLKRRFESIFTQDEEINIEEVLNRHTASIKENKEQLMAVVKQQSEIQTRLNFSVQKVGFVRYNAFDDLTNELSFTSVWLDSFNNGLLMTCVHGRQQAQIFTKEIKGGKSALELSAHEKEALDMALAK